MKMKIDPNLRSNILGILGYTALSAAVGSVILFIAAIVYFGV